MRLAFIVSLGLNILLAIAMVQALQRDRNYSGALKPYDDCQYEVGPKQELLIYANSNDLCEALMALPSGHLVTLTW